MKNKAYKGANKGDYEQIAQLYYGRLAGLNAGMIVCEHTVTTLLDSRMVRFQDFFKEVSKKFP